MQMATDSAESDTADIARWRAVLVEQGIISSSSRWVALAGGRTNRVWRVAEPGSPLVCRLFGADNNPLYPNRPEAEHLVLGVLAGKGMAPDPVALVRHEGEVMLINRYVAGMTGPGNPRDVARLLGRLHGFQGNLPLRRIGAGGDALVAQTERILRACRGLPSDLPRRMAIPDVAVPRREVLLHTDVVAGNIVTTDSGPVLIDWQCPAIGDPCEDIASYLSPAMQYLYAGKVMHPSCRAAFLAAYPDPRVVERYRTLAPLYHWRMAAYCLWRVERGARDYGRALKIELAALHQAQRNEQKAGRDYAQSEISG